MRGLPVILAGRWARLSRSAGCWAGRGAGPRWRLGRWLCAGASETELGRAWVERRTGPQAVLGPEAASYFSSPSLILFPIPDNSTIYTLVPYSYLHVANM